MIFDKDGGIVYNVETLLVDFCTAALPAVIDKLVPEHSISDRDMSRIVNTTLTIAEQMVKALENKLHEI